MLALYLDEDSMDLDLYENIYYK